MQRYQTEDEHRKAMRAKINKTIKRGRRRKRIIRRLNKAVPGICIGVLIAGMGAWCIAAPLPDPDDYEPYRFQAENGQWYTQEEYEQMSRERDAYHQREREEAEKEGRQETMIIQLEIPKEFAKDYANNRFDDFFRRVYADIDNEGMCGNYEGETAQMMARAFKESRCLDYEKTR